MRLKFFYTAILVLGMGAFASPHECTGHCKGIASPATGGQKGIPAASVSPPVSETKPAMTEEKSSGTESQSDIKENDVPREFSLLSMALHIS